MLSGFYKVETCLLKAVEAYLTLCTHTSFMGLSFQAVEDAPRKSSLGLNPEGGHEAPLTIAPINYTTELLFAETRGPVFSICISWSLAVSTPY